MLNENATAPAPAIPPSLRLGDAKREVIYREEAKEGFLCALFVGDVILAEDKVDESKRLGGHQFRDSYCLPFKILIRCAITPMYVGHMSVHSAFIHKDERKAYKKAFVQKNVWNVGKQCFEDVLVGGAHTAIDEQGRKVSNRRLNVVQMEGLYANFGRDLLYAPINPTREIASLSRTGGHPNGVVPIRALADEREVAQAQMFMFPQWGEFVRGNPTAIPTNLRKLRAHCEERRQAAAASGNPKLVAVADAYLAACDLYREWGKRYVDNQTSIIKDADKLPGAPARYDEIAERIIIDLELTREDRLVQNVAAQQNNMEAVVAQNAEMLRLMAENQKAMLEIMNRREGERVSTPAQLSEVDKTPERPAVPSAPVASPDPPEAEEEPEVIDGDEPAEGSHVDNGKGMEDLENE